MGIQKINAKRFLIYELRWVSSSIVLAPCIWFFQELNGWDAFSTAVIGNIIGGAIYYNIDKLIFKK